ncbi:hypothetical protein [Streptomyces sp. TRM68367]|uniref:hypothetical protein n=1 Tax=Streptomyces sp. TRM68367 TaxID=2758415 RepID=UPI00165B2ECE|nr:hypothetical protein [Streptomyces sp. TRM68367]MBC9727081.1 hypothetical protein [Streptomyces sp. TRM68367]
MPGVELPERGHAAVDNGVIPNCLLRPSRPAFHLVHRSPSWEYYAVDAPSRYEELFTVSGELPAGTAPAGGRTGQFHDTRFLTELVLHTGGLIGHRYFGIPSYLPARLSVFELDAHDPAAWHAGQDPASFTVDLRVRPDQLPDRAPHRLQIEGAASLNSVPCARVTAVLGFRVSVPLSAPEPAGPAFPVAPAEVGVTEPESVLIGTPVLSSYGRLTSPVLVSEDLPRLGARPDREVSDLTLVEAVRQASLLCARLTCGLRPQRSVTTALTVRRRGSAVAGAQLHITAVPGTLQLDERGHPCAPVVLTVHQGGRAVVEATAEVHQDL